MPLIHKVNKSQEDIDKALISAITGFLTEHQKIVKLEKLNVTFPNSDVKLKYVWLTKSNKLYIIDEHLFKFRASLGVFPLSKLFRIVRIAQRLEDNNIII